MFSTDTGFISGAPDSFLLTVSKPAGLTFTIQETLILIYNIKRNNITKKHAKFLVIRAFYQSYTVRHPFWS